MEIRIQLWLPRARRIEHLRIVLKSTGSSRTDCRVLSDVGGLKSLIKHILLVQMTQKVASCRDTAASVRVGSRGSSHVGHVKTMGSQFGGLLLAGKLRLSGVRVLGLILLRALSSLGGVSKSVVPCGVKLTRKLLEAPVLRVDRVVQDVHVV